MAAPSELYNTSFEFLLTIFRVNSDQELVGRMTNIFLGYTLFHIMAGAIFPAPYGKHSSPNWGPTINAKFAWTFQETPVIMFPILMALLTPSGHLFKPGNFIPLILIVAHYFNRTIIYPWKMNSAARPFPVLFVVHAWFFCAFNGILQAHHLLNVQEISDAAWLGTGSGLFITGMAINIHHDDLLQNLRKTGNAQSSTDVKNKSDGGGYKIPRGGLFEYISGANYFGEILEWWGFALTTCESPQITFAIFSSVFLGIRALHHHSWYKKNFGRTYPPSRKAIIPFLL